jgi:hypothetical protein
MTVPWLWFHAHELPNRDRIESYSSSTEDTLHRHRRSEVSTYNTNLAAEFYVLSILHRLGFDATMTLGNKKAVDRP